MKIPFGKYIGKEIEETPDDYLTWLLESSWFDKKYPKYIKPIEDELAYRERWDKHLYREEE